MEAGGKIYGEEIDGRRTNLVSGELGGLRKLKSFSKLRCVEPKLATNTKDDAFMHYSSLRC